MKTRFFSIISAIFILFSLSSCGYNTMVDKRENVSGKWAQVQNAYQRRTDLIPNLVNTVKGAANFERETLTQVIEARSRATSVNINNVDSLTPQKFQQFQQAQDALGSSLSRLLVTVERYPELRANQNFLELQAQLEGTENRISVERKNFNDAVQDYNSYIAKFPNNLSAGMFGFQSKPYFEAQAGADRAPTVNF
jgi:LemA protein